MLRGLQERHVFIVGLLYVLLGVSLTWFCECLCRFVLLWVGR